MLRTITIVSSDAPKTAFEADVTTMGELRNELINRGISYEGKSMFEGITKADYGTSTDDTVLPHDLTWKGEVTNNLIFMLTASKKKISSGMDRKEAYIKIKEMGLQDVIMDSYHKNYTNVPTAQLEQIIADYSEDKKEEQTDCQECPFKVVLFMYLEALLNAELLSATDFIEFLEDEKILQRIKENKDTKKTLKGEYSDTDAEELFAGMC